MYVVTFYSYKGGVGRTMALANVAVLLAEAGKRVLCVDFDLEAPGLPSYAIFGAAAARSGVVDYVNAYRENGVAPNVPDYIVECKVDERSIWLMPAGRHTEEDYSEQLNAIDWQELYEHQSGYLMFEDLKQQWAQFDHLGFDYVLIDSRTGHTDVGGICTRQLPDAVVILFLPNDQNISGLVPIVNAIKAETRTHKKSIDILYCASNIPDLDDEKSILSDLLDDARKRFKDAIDVQVHHYNSMELLDTKPFALSRRNSKLSKELKELRTAIISKNFSDRDGAIVALKAMPEAYEKARSEGSEKALKVIRSNAVQICLEHEEDGEIAYLAARVFDMLGDQQEELVALDRAISKEHEVNRSLLARAHVYAMQERRSDATSDLMRLLADTGSTLFEIVPALQILRFVEEERWLEGVQRVLARDDSEFEMLSNLHVYLMMEREALPAVASRFVRSVSSDELSAEQREQARNIAALAFIGSGAFTAARNLLEMAGNSEKGAIATNLFNFALACWGERGAPLLDQFQQIADLIPEAPARSPNMNQCYGLTHALLGDIEAARRDLDTAITTANPGALMFSCWQFLYVQGEEFKNDSKEILDRVASGEEIIPPFLSLNSQSLH